MLNKVSDKVFEVVEQKTTTYNIDEVIERRDMLIARRDMLVSRINAQIAELDAVSTEAISAGVKIG